MVSVSKRIVVTGAHGFVGRHLVRALVQRLDDGDQVFALSHGLGAGGESVPVSTALDLVSGPVDQRISELRPTHTIHLAAKSSVKESWSAGGSVFETNLVGTLRLIEALRRHAPGSRFIFASSSEVYGKVFSLTNGPDESAPVAPGNPYGRSKLACELAIQDLLADVCPCITLRLFNQFGPGQQEQFVIASFAAQLARIVHKTTPPQLSVGNLDAERDFLDVDDAVDAYLATIFAGGDDPPGYRLFNVGSGTTRSIRSILDDLIALSGASVTIEQRADRIRPSDIPRAAGNCQAFQRQYGWQPQIPWLTSLKRVLESHGVNIP